MSNGSRRKRWIAAVNADGSYGRWRYDIAKRVADIPTLLNAARPN